MHKLGLLGKNISYSFSRAYFKNKFESERITDWSYENFDIDHIEAFATILKNTPNLKGLNVTTPYKLAVIPYLDQLDKQAQEIGAVNTIRVTGDGKLVGYNTDCYGFEKSIAPLLNSNHNSALILGTGGASKAIAYGLKHLGIPYKYVSRTASNHVSYTYDDLTETIIKQHFIIINCTPLGTFPNVKACPDIPYGGITENHVLYDLIYNPNETSFLRKGKEHGATICNGLKMLELQAEKSWSIWNLD
ncbi:shikimate dehydrogenase family protein [Aestuariivivens sediminis]|uniref:shikimate dehydrogenase family protein n=1 Tax=Aestuariivivens sediminis TaxID=2913557 RepID=UPI001F56A018|nr:shikimate dehydrogenase [Aestuariivivens sediminis]